MALFIAIALAITAVGTLAAQWGVDTRPSYVDDHAR